MSSFYVDAREIYALGDRLEGGDKIMRSALTEAVSKTGTQGQALAQTEAPVRWGTLRRSIIKGPVLVSGNAITVLIGTVLKYAPWVHDGRGPIMASGKALGMRIGGSVVFRKKAGPAKANPFMDRAFAKVQPILESNVQLAATQALVKILGS